MKRVPEKGRDTTGGGRARGLPRRNRLAGPGSVFGPSSSDRLSVSLNAGRLGMPPFQAANRLPSGGYCQPVRAVPELLGEPDINGGYQRGQQPAGASESVEARSAETVRTRPVGLRAECRTSVRAARGPTGGRPDKRSERRETSCCAVRADDAEVCGALGCRETDRLFVVRQDGERRVLCELHARRWSA